MNPHWGLCDHHSAKLGMPVACPTVVDLEESTVERDAFEMFFPDRTCLRVSVGVQACGATGLKDLPLQPAGHPLHLLHEGEVLTPC